MDHEFESLRSQHRDLVILEAHGEARHSLVELRQAFSAAGKDDCTRHDVCCHETPPHSPCALTSALSGRGVYWAGSGMGQNASGSVSTWHWHFGAEPAPQITDALLPEYAGASAAQ